MKLFIRSFALRNGVQNTAPWMVSEEMVKKHKLVGKFAEIFMSPGKVSLTMLPFQRKSQLWCLQYHIHGLVQDVTPVAPFTNMV